MPLVVWRTQLTGQSPGGVAATKQFVVLSDRDVLDQRDVFRCLQASNGKQLWELSVDAPGRLDYGNGARATPLIEGEHVYLYNAFGHLVCAKLATGEIVWQKNLVKQFNGWDNSNAWGTAASPLLVDGRLIVNPGGPEASVVALDPMTGEVLWQTPGEQAAFASFIVGTFGGQRQLVGYEKRAIVGLDPDTGKQIWRLEPPNPHDFNVPTPMEVNGQLLVTTENNGTRLYEFDRKGIIVATPIASNDDLAPDTHTPVVVGDRVFGIWLGLVCLDLKDQLKTVYIASDPAFDGYGVLVASEGRVLALTQYGELILFHADDDHFKPVSRLRVFEDDPGVYSHPAFDGTRMYVRGSSEILCLELSPQQK